MTGLSTSFVGRFLFSLVVLLGFLSTSSVVTAASSSISSLPSSHSSNGNVEVDFYSESLCPYCANFVLNYLSKIIENGLTDIMDLRIIPYGNAHSHNREIVCQHGEDECKLNVVQTCAINLWPTVKEWFPFIFCLEKLVVDLPRLQVFPNWKTCVEPSGLAVEPIEQCFSGPLGEKLEWDFALETDSLKPPHRYVPWVVVDGTPLYDDYVYSEKFVCQAYNGSKAKPSACEKYGGSGSAMIESILQRESTVGGVCVRD